ncbi:MAG TPA: hypothetical protein DHV30_05415 [Balneola sp.]|jgi:hypothetical protein|nr:hypothetical protein [Balneola sp.]|tara:strand:+ start:3961 stop:4404 length:444 start_codon:yes stop_codon:yes gene_type:complete
MYKLIPILLVLFFISCSGSGDSDEQVAVGMKIKNGSAVIVTQTGTTVDGQIEITEDTNMRLTVLFIDENGEEFTPSFANHTYNVGETGNNISASNFNTTLPPFAFTLTATDTSSLGNSISILVKQGSTTEFFSQPVPVVVTEATSES